MPETLLQQYEALKRSAFGNQQALNDCPRLAELLIRLLGHVIAEQQEDGWAPGNKFEVLANAHMLRVLTSMGIDVHNDRWRGLGPKGNLESIAERLTGLYQEKKAQPSLFGEDFWDDCYVMLALYAVPRAPLKKFLDAHEKDIADFLLQQASTNFANVKHGSWYGPGLHAAGIHYIDALLKRKVIKPKKVEAALAKLVDGIVDLLKKPDEWRVYYGWQAGQVLSVWRRLRKERPQLQELEAHIDNLENDLLSRQDRDPHSPTYGGWTGGGMSGEPREIVYNTTRALAAIYDRAADAYKSDEAQAAHAFLLAQWNDSADPFHSLKARVNTIEVLHDLFRLRLPMRDVGLLLSVAGRLDKLGLQDVLLGRVGAFTVDTLRDVQRRVREQIEDKGKIALEPMGVNGRVFDDLRERATFMDEFGEDSDVKERLTTFLSATMTETRTNAAVLLLRDLWTHAGYFNFLPFFERLANLQHEGKFFEKYRDHINHQVLVFLLGAYIYYRDSRLRKALNEEIVATADARGIDVPDVEKEFLFRWKLTSNFHDVGYIFEVSPKSADPAKETETLTSESLKMIDDFRNAFLTDFVAVQLPDEDAAPILKPLDIAVYSPIHELADLFELKRSGSEIPNAFDKMSSFIPEEWQKAALFWSYFTMCRGNDADGTALKRPRFLDHGIMSALILLKTVDVQHHYFEELDRLAGAGKVKNAKLLELLKTDTFRKHVNEKRYVRFDHVAGAIALHNIYPRLYSQATCAKYEMADTFYPDRKFLIQTPYALAYLLALTDGLQDWDRHSFRRPNFSVKEESEPLSAPEVLMTAGEDGVTVTGLSAAARERYARRLEEMQETLAELPQYMHVRT